MATTRGAFKNTSSTSRASTECLTALLRRFPASQSKPVSWRKSGKLTRVYLADTRRAVNEAKNRNAFTLPPAVPADPKVGKQSTCVHLSTWKAEVDKWTEVDCFGIRHKRNSSKSPKNRTFRFQSKGRPGVPERPWLKWTGVGSYSFAAPMR